MQIIILAAGKGTRMKSRLPKVMHQVGVKSMIEHVIDNCRTISDDLMLVYSDHLEPYLNQIAINELNKLNFYEGGNLRNSENETLSFEETTETKTKKRGKPLQSIKFVKQEKQLGTAHAVFCAKKFFTQDDIAVIYGDNPLITGAIIQKLHQHLKDTDSKVVTLAFEYDRPNEYGRIITDESGNFLKIVETKFANAEQKRITLCNSGIMVFAPGILEKYIDQCIEGSGEKEFYLTDIIEVCVRAGERVSYYKAIDHQLVIGINTKEELIAANKFINE